MPLRPETRWIASDNTEHKTEVAGAAHEAMLADIAAHVAASGYAETYQPRIVQILRSWAVSRGVDPARLRLGAMNLEPPADAGQQTQEMPE